MDTNSESWKSLWKPFVKKVTSEHVGIYGHFLLTEGIWHIYFPESRNLRIRAAGFRWVNLVGAYISKVFFVSVVFPSTKGSFMTKTPEIRLNYTGIVKNTQHRNFIGWFVQRQHHDVVFKKEWQIVKHVNVEHFWKSCIFTYIFNV